MTQLYRGYAVIWDLDGVIADTAEPHYVTFRDVLAEAGQEFSREQFQACFGRNNHAVLESVFGYPPEAGLAERMIEKKENAFCELVRQHSSMLPGVAGWLAQFRDWGMKQAIASSSPPGNIDALVDGLGIRQYFDDLISGAYLPPKPNPEIFLEAARLVGISAERCVVIEDAIAGVDGAASAGMRCVAVETTHPAEKLSRAGIVVPTLAELDSAAFTRLLEGAI
jgi:HAD superfamily hydrolase (TIGR01509 family)